MTSEEARRFVATFDCEKLSWSERDKGEECPVDGCKNPVKWQVNHSNVRLCWLCSGCG